MTEWHELCVWMGFVEHLMYCNDMGTHLADDPSKEGKEKWLKDDNLLNQIMNSMEDLVQDLVRHCTTVKQSWEYLESFYANKQDLFHVHGLLSGLY